MSSNVQPKSMTVADGLRKPRLIAVEQRQFAVSDDPDAELSAILGSCVSICLHDPVNKVGGMTHTVFPTTYDNGEMTILNEFELLFNALMKRGSRRGDLQASVVGGANLIQSSRQAGHDLGEVTLQVLRAEEMKICEVDLGGSLARRVRFKPVQGNLIVRYIGEAVQDAPAKAPANGEPDISFF